MANPEKSEGQEQNDRDQVEVPISHRSDQDSIIRARMAQVAGNIQKDLKEKGGWVSASDVFELDSLIETRGTKVRFGGVPSSQVGRQTHSSSRRGQLKGS